MDKAERDGLRELEAKATPGPWRVDHMRVTDDAPSHYCVPIHGGQFSTPAHCYGASPSRAANADFIAALRNAARDLLDAADRAESLLNAASVAEHRAEALLTDCANLEQRLADVTCDLGQRAEAAERRVAELEACLREMAVDAAPTDNHRCRLCERPGYGHSSGCPVLKAKELLK